jgi:hypothetical protein
MPKELFDYDAKRWPDDGAPRPGTSFRSPEIRKVTTLRRRRLYGA